MGQPEQAVVLVPMRDGRAALALPEIEEMFRASVKDIDDIDADELLQWVLQSAHLPANMITLIRDGTHWVGYVICIYEPWVWSHDAQMVMIHVGKGPRKAIRKALCQAIRAWLIEKGSPRMVSVASPDWSCEATCRLWNGDGLRVERHRDTVCIFPEE